MYFEQHDTAVLACSPFGMHEGGWVVVVGVAVVEDVGCGSGAPPSGGCPSL
jgi:hypothetical protein